jgi:arginyl-tRNA synthetase
LYHARGGRRFLQRAIYHVESISHQLQRAFRSAIKEATGIDADPLLGVAQNEKFGDYQANAAMGLAKQLGQNPRAIAEKIKSHLNLGPIAQEVTIAGPGFINIRLSPTWLAAQLGETLAVSNLGIEPVQSPQTIVVDYSGPNVAKEMHVGHLRSTIIGDSISRVLEFQGHKVIRQNHIGDWGTQFGMLIAHLRFGLHRSGTGASLSGANFPDGDPFKGTTITDLELLYRDAKRAFDEDPTFADLARAAVVRLQAGGSEELSDWNRIVEASRREYEQLYERLGVLLTKRDERSESSYNSVLANVVEELTAKGIARQSEGALAVFTDASEAPLIIQKRDGGFLYGTTDLAALRYRITEMHAQRIVYTHDSRQALHFAQVFAATRKANWGEHVVLEYAPFGTMLGADGRPFKSRSGHTIKLKDLLNEAEERALAVVTAKSPQLAESQRNAIAHSVGIGAIKYADLSKDRISDYLFSWDSMLALDGNTAPYLQYAFARIASIFRRGETTLEASAHATLTLDSPFELALAKQILRLGDVIELVGRELKPHHLAGYLYELASRFSGFFDNCPVLKSDEPLRSSRLALCAATGRALGIGLDLLGIEHPEQM